MRKLFLTATALLPFLLAGIDTADWELANRDAKFAVREIRDGVLKLNDEDAGKTNQSLVKRYSGAKEVREFLGRELTFSGDIRQLSASRAGVVGLSIGYKTRDNAVYTRSVRIQTAEATDFGKYSVSLRIPENVYSVTLGIDSATGYGNTASAEFRNLQLETRQLAADGSNAAWNAGYGTAVRYGAEVVPWRFREWNAARLNIIAGGRQIQLLPEGEVQLMWGDADSMMLRGDGANARLEIEVADRTPFAVDWLSYGKRNRTVEAVPAEASKGGTLKIIIPIEKFAPFHDLAKFEGLVFRVSAPVTVKSIAITGLDDTGPVVNLLPDPGFETCPEPRPNYDLFGDYLAERAGKGYAADTGKAFDGKRSLRLEPGGFYTWCGFDKVGHGSAFSIHAAGPGELQLELQPVLLEHHGSGIATRYTATVKPGADWQRFFVTGKRPEKRVAGGELALYRAVVRNIGSTPVNIDAVQLEQDTETPREYTPVRDSRFRFRVDETLPMTRYPGLKIGKQTKQGEIRLKAVGVSGPESVVRGGIPFAKGELFDLAGVTLLDRSGNPVPAQFEALARRPIDGSVISLLAVFRAGSDGDYLLKYGGADRNDKRSPLATAIDGGYLIDTGKLRLRLDANQDLFRCVAVTPDGREHCGKPELIELQENGPESCTVFLRGTSLLAWELRITAEAGKPYCRVAYSFERNFTPDDQLMQRVRSIYLRLPGVPGENRTVVQRHTREGEAEWDVLEIENGKRSVEPGKRLSGRFEFGKTGLLIRDFSELAPRGVSVSPQALKLYQWPEEGVADLDVPLGFSETMEFLYAPDGGALPEHDALLQPDPAYVASTGVFGDFLPMGELERKFPKSARLIESVYEGNREAGRMPFLQGFGDYGDFGSRNYYANHETAAVGNLWVQYLQTGLAEDFDMAARHARHMRDVDQCHFRRGTSGVHPHNAWSNFTYNFHTGHFWLSGVIDHYLLTGDRRSLEKAIGAAAILIQKSQIQYKGGRERHRMLLHLADIYELCGLPEIRKAFELQYAMGGVSDSSSYYGGIAALCLYRLYEVTGDRQYLDRLLAEAKEFRAKNGNPPPMPELRSAAPTMDGSANEGRAGMVLYSGGLVSRLTGDSGYLPYLWRGGIDPLMCHLLAINSRDNSVGWTAPYLAEMARRGIAENPMMPDDYFFSYHSSGKMLRGNSEAPFIYEITPDSNGMVTLDVHRIRRFRYWQYKGDNDRATVKLRTAGGKVLNEETLYGNVPFESRRIALKAPDATPVVAEVRFENDCWGGVSSPNRMRLSADRVFTTRSSVGVPYSFTLTAPESGRIAIDWRWNPAKNSFAGSPLAVRVETLEGRKIAESCYVIPFADAGDRHRTELTIPAEYRGRKVRVWMPDEKWIEWKIEGVDYLENR